MSTVLVTGGTGYIGSHTCVELLNNGYDIIIVDNFCNSSPNVAERIEQITGKKVKLCKCDLCYDVEKLDEIFKENKIDAVMHFAGLKSVSESIKFPILYYENNVFGTINLCKAMQKHNVKKIIFSSSATVYGTSSFAPYDETMPTGDVSNPYGRTKYIVEKLFEDLCNSDALWNVVILRYFNPIGAHESGLIGESPRGIPNNLMPYISLVAAGKLDTLTIFGKDYDTPDGTCIRDYIHVVDLARGHVCALSGMTKLSGVNVYNLGTSKGTSVLELINAFQRVTSRKVKYAFGERRKGDIPVVYANADKAYKELGFKAEYGIKRMCIDTWRWQCNQD